VFPGHSRHRVVVFDLLATDLVPLWPLRVEVVDDDGESANISFLVRQQTDSTQTFSDSSLSLGIALFFILSIVVIALMRQRSSSDGPSGFVKWTERGKEPKN